MKRNLILICIGICMMLTACQKEQNQPESVSIEPVTELVTETETQPETEHITEAVPITPANPEEIIGIWKDEVNNFVWFREDGTYIDMSYQGTFPEDMQIEQDNQTVILSNSKSGLVWTLTPAGTHVFDTLDGLYDVSDKEYQMLIIGNMVYIYDDHEITYQFNGKELLFSGAETSEPVPCVIDGDVMQFEENSFVRTHDLDDFLINN